MKNILTSLEEKKLRLDSYRPLPGELITNLSEWFKIELTYTSNAIEGNTLSRAETALVIDKGLTVSGKTLQEHQEAINHAQAFDWVTEQAKTTGRSSLTESTILDLHQRILHKIDDRNAGRYRTVPVRIYGSTVIMPNPLKVKELMTQFLSWLHQTHDHPLQIALDAHLKLVSVHPFVDGNGRTARLLMNLLLMQAGYPPAIVLPAERKEYVASIEKVQLGGSPADYHALMYRSIDRSLDIYLDSLEDEKQQQVLTKKNLLKIGQLARLSSQTVPTIRHWTKEGLLSVEGYTQGHYQLYSPTQLPLIKKIKKLQDKDRLTIAEIKRHIQTTS